MAEVASRSEVRAGEGPTSARMIEGAVRPGDGVVACGAQRGRITERYVVRHGAAERPGAVPIGSVAAGVIAVRNRQTVIVSDVALVAVGGRACRCHLVVAGQCPAGRGVAPGSHGEGRRRGVAVRAIRDSEGGARRGVHRIVGAVVIGCVTVAVTASCSWSLEVVAARGCAVTQSAGHRGVQAGEGEAGVVVIEGGVGPIDHVVAGVAGLREI